MKWMAGKRDATYSDKPDPAQVQILSVGDLHLNAVSSPEVVRAAKQRFLEQHPERKALAAPAELRDLDEKARRQGTVASIAREYDVPELEVERAMTEVADRERAARKSGNQPTSNAHTVPGLDVKFKQRQDVDEDPDD